MQNSQNAAIQALFERLKSGPPLAVWATLREDNYETVFGDGYYAYLDRVFLTPTGPVAWSLRMSPRVSRSAALWASRCTISEATVRTNVSP
jgi:hypothetical protein